MADMEFKQSKENPFDDEPSVSASDDVKRDSAADLSEEQKTQQREGDKKARKAMTACIINTYKEVNGRDCPKFTAADWTQLSNFLRHCSWSIDDITRCIGNVFKSEAHRLSPPHKWLPHLSEFVEGPRNEFYQPIKQNSNGRKGKPKSVEPDYFVDFKTGKPIVPDGPGETTKRYLEMAEECAESNPELANDFREAVAAADVKRAKNLAERAALRERLEKLAVENRAAALEKLAAEKRAAGKIQHTDDPWEKIWEKLQSVRPLGNA